MKHVTIRRCPECPNIKRLTQELQAEMKNDSEYGLHVVDGDIGEFTVELDGKQVLTNPDGMLPSIAEITSAIRADARREPMGSTSKQR